MTWTLEKARRLQSYRKWLFGVAVLLGTEVGIAIATFAWTMIDGEHSPWPAVSIAAVAITAFWTWRWIAEINYQIRGLE